MIEKIDVVPDNYDSGPLAELQAKLNEVIEFINTNWPDEVSDATPTEQRTWYGL